MTQKQEQTTSLRDFFNDDEMQVAEILGQLPQLVLQDKFNTSFLPLWGSRGLRSVLVNIPPPVRRPSQLRPPIVPCSEKRASNGQPPILPTLPSSSNAEPAHERKKKSKTKHRLKIVKREQELIGKAEPPPTPTPTPPPPSPSPSPAPTTNLDPLSEMKICVGGRQTESFVEYKIGITVSKELKRVAVPVAVEDPTLIPKETLLMGCFFQPLQLNKTAIYAEARKRRKLEMKRG